MSSRPQWIHKKQTWVKTPLMNMSVSSDSVTSSSDDFLFHNAPSPKQRPLVSLGMVERKINSINVDNVQRSFLLGTIQGAMWIETHSNLAISKRCGHGSVFTIHVGILFSESRTFLQTQILEFLSITPSSFAGFFSDTNWDIL